MARTLSAPGRVLATGAPFARPAAADLLCKAIPRVAQVYDQLSLANSGSFVLVGGAYHHKGRLFHLSSQVNPPSPHRRLPNYKPLVLYWWC